MFLNPAGSQGLELERFENKKKLRTGLGQGRVTDGKTVNVAVRVFVLERFAK